MRSTLLLLTLLVCSACRQEPSKPGEAAAETETPKTLLERLADRHGFRHWKEVNRIRFTFNVDRDTTHYERSWIWDVRENRVTRISGGDTLTYLRSAVDSLTAPADAGFINDKYWLLAPYQWVWDRESITHEYQDSVQAPISGKPMARLTVVYGSEGGYTPGDAYDFYLGKDSVVREWVYRKGNQPDPSLATTWEEYQEFGGLLLSTGHRNAEGTFRLYFTGISVE